MREELMALLPELKFFSNSGLQEKVITVWHEALRKGGWKIEDLHEIPFTLLIEKTSVNFIEHTRAVTLCALKMADVISGTYGERVKINKDYLLAGALLHDIGKLFEYKRDNNRFVKSEEGKLLRHPVSGAVFASKHGLPPEVIHIIAAHSKEGDGLRRTAEAVILHHADFTNFEILIE